MSVLFRCVGAFILVCSANLFAQNSGSTDSPHREVAVQPPSAESKAQVTEADILLRNLEQGGEADRLRLNTLTLAISQDMSLPEYDRYSVAARVRGLAIHETRGITHAARMAAHEQSARDLLTQFPDQPEPYEALLALAVDQPDQTASERIANELLSMSAPDAVKARAQRLLDSYAMVGQVLEFTYDDGMGLPLDLAHFRGKIVVLYAWTGAGKRSHHWLRRLMSYGNSEVIFVGVNFDPDKRQAQGRAAEVALGSRQIYADGGFDGEVARALNINRIPAIYLVDRTGVVRNVRARKDFPEQLTRLVKEGGES